MKKIFNQKINIDSDEIKFLQDYYNQASIDVKDNLRCMDFINEKIVHVNQVINVGDYIMKNQGIFKVKSKEYLNCARCAYVFHDIGRFEEIRRIAKNDDNKTMVTSGMDHGEIGADIISQISIYNDPRIVLPVRHHGHLIECLYNDPEYQVLCNDMKKEVIEILALTKDADKVANFHMLATEFDEHVEAWLFSNKKENMIGDVSPKVIDAFKQHSLVKSVDRKNNADKFVAILAWVFDLSYPVSLKVCSDLSYIDDIFEILKRYNKQDKLQRELKTTIESYIAKKVS